MRIRIRTRISQIQNTAFKGQEEEIVIINT